MKFIFLFLIIITTNAKANVFNLNIEKFRSKLKEKNPLLKVTYKNHLGEGEGQLDSMPRYNSTNVNCTTWWQQLLAESFTTNEKDLNGVLDSIRYFDSVVSFGTRKHFVDHFLMNQPSPLTDINQRFGDFCDDDSTHQVKLNIDLFKQSAKYSCPILHEEQNNIEFTYLSKFKAIDCLEKAPDGVYMVFPVATPKYLAIWGKKSGPMGRVHGLIVNKEKIPQVFHASIDWGRIMTEPFKTYVLAPGSNLFKGYKIYKIDDQYKISAPQDKNKEKIQKILACERQILQSKNLNVGNNIKK